MKSITIFDKSFLRNMPGKEKINWQDAENGKIIERGKKGRFCSIPVKVYQGKGNKHYDNH